MILLKSLNLAMPETPEFLVTRADKFPFASVRLCSCKRHKTESRQIPAILSIFTLPGVLQSPAEAPPAQEAVPDHGYLQAALFLLNLHCGFLSGRTQAEQIALQMV